MKSKSRLISFPLWTNFGCFGANAIINRLPSYRILIRVRRSVMKMLLLCHHPSVHLELVGIKKEQLQLNFARINCCNQIFIVDSSIYRHVKIIPKTICRSIATPFDVMHHISEKSFGKKIGDFQRTLEQLEYWINNCVSYVKFSFIASSSRMLTVMPRIEDTSPASL